MNNLNKIFISRSFNISKIRGSFAKSKLISTNNVFVFSTLRHDDADQLKITNLLSNIKQIKVWSIEQILFSIMETRPHSQNNVKGINTQKMLKNKLQDFMNKSHQSKNSLNIVINKYFSSLQQFSGSNSITKVSQKQIAPYKILIDLINQSQKWSFLPHHTNIQNRQKSSNKSQLKLLIGDYNEPIIKHFSPNSYVTLEQLCAMYPQKVPLSYRKRQPIQSIRQSISTRLSQGRQQKISLKEEPRFNEIIIINDKIKMWDEAYQIMLDQLPIKITVPFHLIEQSQKFHKLNLRNFLQGFKTCHRIIHPQIPLHIQQQNIEQFLLQYFRTITNDLPQKIPKIEVQIMDKSLNVHDNNKRFQLLL